MPGTRLIIVERDPRDALLNWLGFGWLPGFACPAPVVAADWLVRARHHLAFASELAEPSRLTVVADALLAGDEHASAQLARFLAVDGLRRGGQFAASAHGHAGLPARFAAGHWQAYEEALGEAFNRLQ